MVRRITGGQLDGQLWGTDLSYNDLKQLQNAFSGSQVTLEPLDGATVAVTSGLAGGDRVVTRAAALLNQIR